MRAEEEDDARLMSRAAAGDDAAFDLLLRRWRDPVRHFAARLLVDPEEAEDVAQEVFLRIYRARAGYRPEARFSTYLFHVARNVCLNHRRTRRPRTGGASAATQDPGASPADRAYGEEIRAAVRGAVAALPEGQRVALVLNQFHGMDYAGVAEAMEVSTDSVRALLARARAGLRTRLARWVGAAEPRA